MGSPSAMYRHRSTSGRSPPTLKATHIRRGSREPSASIGGRPRAVRCRTSDSTAPALVSPDFSLKQTSLATRGRTGWWDGVHQFPPRTEGRCRNVAIRRAHFLDRKRQTSICDV